MNGQLTIENGKWKMDFKYYPNGLNPHPFF